MESNCIKAGVAVGSKNGTNSNESVDSDDSDESINFVDCVDFVDSVCTISLEAETGKASKALKECIAVDLMRSLVVSVKSLPPLLLIDDVKLVTAT